MEGTNRVAFELFLCWFISFNIGQTRNIIPLKAAMTRRAGQMRDRRLERVQAVIQQQWMPAERDEPPRPPRTIQSNGLPWALLAYQQPTSASSTLRRSSG